MGSNTYRYFSQKKFHGGIETRQEFIEDNQLLDARNHWSPLGEMEQRPGTAAKMFTGAITAGATFTPFTVIQSSSSTDTALTPGTSNLNGFAFGDSLVLHYASATLTARQAVTTLGLFTTTAVANVLAKTRVVLQVYTARGWTNVEYELLNTLDTPGTVPANTFMYPFAAATTSGTDYLQYLNFAMPEDWEASTQTFSFGDLTGFFVRLIFKSATTLTGSPFTAGVILSGTSGSLELGVVQDNGPSFANTNARSRVPGAWLLKYGSGNQIVSMYVRPAVTSSSGYLNFPYMVLHRGHALALGSSLYNTVRYDVRFTAPALPPTVAVLPEWNMAYLAYANLVFELPYDGPYFQSDVHASGTNTKAPLVAQVNTDPLIVGPISVENPAVPYSTDLIPQLTAFPAANLIVYFRNQLFCSGIQGIGNLIRWSGSSTDGAYNVWPEDNQVTLSTAKDNSDITAIAPLGDNLVVFKKNSIWQMIDNGISDVNLPLYEPRLVVAGVGTVAHQSVQAVQGGLIFLAEDGFYFYDGTPNIKRISDPIQPYTDRINPARSPFAVATVWRSKQAYMCAVSLDSETQANDFVFVYAYDTGAWWVWDGWDAQCWLQIDGVGLQEEVYALDNFGRAFKLGAWTQSDNGAEIDSWFLTPRFGFDDAITKTALELRVRGINNNPTVNYNVIGDDVEINVTGSATVDPLTLPITMAGVDESQYANDEVYGTATYAPTRRRERKSANRTTASWFQVRIRKMLKVFGFDLGYEPEGRR